MSYNVRVEFKTTKTNPPWMDAYDIVRIQNTNNDDLPESNFIEEHFAEAVKIVNTKISCTCKTKNDYDAKHCKECGALLPKPTWSTAIKLEKLYWSGNHASDMLKPIAQFIHGRLDAFFVGEDGDISRGAIIENGKYTPCRTEMKLIPET